jgi:hypothetical protein
VQQGSEPQIGVGNGELDPAGNQQQHPLQSVHVALDMSGLHMVLHIEPVDPLLLPLLDPLLDPLLEPLLDPLLEPLLEPLLDPLLEPLLLPLPLPLDVPLLLDVVAPLLLPLPLLDVVPLLDVLPPLLDVVPLLLPPVSPDSPASPSPPEPAGVLLLLQAARPTVDEAPITTRTWNSLSMFMSDGIPHEKARDPPITVSATESRASRVEWLRRDPMPPLRAAEIVASSRDVLLQSKGLG